MEVGGADGAESSARRIQKMKMLFTSLASGILLCSKFESQAGVDTARTRFSEDARVIGTMRGFSETWKSEFGERSQKDQ